MFSHGMDLITATEFSPIIGLEVLFDELPLRDGLYEAAWNHEGGTEHVSFYTANLIKAFGEDWHRIWEEMTTKRLRS